MSTDLENLDDGDDAQVAWLLTSAHDAPEMRREFLSALKGRLDDEFASLHSGGSFKATVAAPAKNGSVHPSPAKWRAETADFDVAAKGEVPGRPRRRWVLSLVVAASVLLAGAVLINPPAWAAAVRAIVLRIEQFATGGVANDAPKWMRLKHERQSPGKKLNRKRLDGGKHKLT